MSSQARRSVRFSKSLIATADKFRKDYLDSDDERDLTVMDDDWTKQEVCHSLPILCMNSNIYKFINII